MRKTLLILILFGLAPSVRAEGDVGASIRALLAARGPAADKYGICVADAKTGVELFGAAARTPRIPASVMKLYTTAGAFLEFGADHVLETKAVAGTRPRADGVLVGDLILLGGGDPTLDLRKDGETEPGSIEELAGHVARSGVARIEGDLVVDDALFDRELRHPDWPANQLHKWYCAPVSALTAARSCITAEVRPGSADGEKAAVRLVPASSAFRLENSVVTTSAKSEQVIIVDVRPGSPVVRVKGRIWSGGPGYDAEVAVPDPAVFCGHVFHRALIRAGVALTGDIVLRPGAAAALAEPIVLGRVGTSVGEILEITNRRSQNLFAECLLKLLGCADGVPGSFAGGAAATARLAAELGVPPEEITQADGSGLCRENRVSPRALISLLSHVYRQSDPLPFLSSLAAGGDPEGSLRSRMKDLGSEVLGKTGTIAGVSALAGYVRAKSGRILCFAVLVNDPRMPAAVARGLQDEICRILWREG